MTEATEIAKPFFHRIVHLDFKGAPWKVDYLAKVIPLFKKWGATGVLLEWEDCFPYVSEILMIGSLGGSNHECLYSGDEVKHILKMIRENGMEPIQLVQTIGHLEFVLKHSIFRRLREYDRSPSSLCPTRAQSRPLIMAMLQQILDADPEAKYIHIGGDEVWHLNQCDECKATCEMLQTDGLGLYMKHIQALASFVRSQRPNITVLLWDDMIRNASVEILNAHNFGTLVQPVVWNYNRLSALNFDIRMWEMYCHVFPKAWVASAYKGANGSCKQICSTERYVSNQEAWLEELKTYEGKISFAGVILTGWSRFDHYATICELLPEALPSLHACLKMWTKPDDMPSAELVSDLLPDEEWPGKDLAFAVRAFNQLKGICLEFIVGDEIMTWMNTWQLEHEYTNPVHVERIYNNSKMLQESVQRVRAAAGGQLAAAGGRRSAAEWLGSVVAPVQDQLAHISHRALARSQLAAPATPTSENRRGCD